MGEQKTEKKSQEEILQEAEKQLEDIKKAESGKTNMSQTSVTKIAKKPRISKARQRSARYQSIYKKVNRSQEYLIEEALALIKEISRAGFDETIDLNLKTKIKKGQQMFREMVEFPAGLAKKQRVAILDQAKIEEIKKGKIDFDIAIVEPKNMALAGQVAKILGPKGLMPNPKLGTITEDLIKAKARFGTKVKEVKADKLGNICVAVGKVSWQDEKILQNIKAVFGLFQSGKVEKAALSSTMGPAVKLVLKSLLVL